MHQALSGSVMINQTKPNKTLEKTTINSIKNFSAEDKGIWAAAWLRATAGVTAIVMVVVVVARVAAAAVVVVKEMANAKQTVRRRQKLNNQLSKIKKLAVKMTAKVVCGGRQWRTALQRRLRWRPMQRWRVAEETAATAAAECRGRRPMLLMTITAPAKAGAIPARTMMVETAAEAAVVARRITTPPPPPGGGLQS